MTQLEELDLQRLRSPELTLLRQLPRLRRLTLENLSGTVDYSALTALTRLEFLDITVDDALAARRISEIAFGELRSLEHLHLGNDSPHRPQITLAWFPTPRLRALQLRGFRLNDDSLKRVIEHGAQLRQFGFSPASPKQEERAAALERRLYLDIHDVGVAPLGTVSEDMNEGGVTTYWIAMDLADLLGVESNVDAEIALRRAIHQRAPNIAERLRYDTESSAVWVESRRREDLELLQRIAEELARPG
jgi:hypothetical protein